MKKMTLALVGAGMRGQDSYAPYVAAHPYQFEFVAVAEPIPERRERFANTFSLPKERCFYDADELFSHPKLADGVMICTQDAQHFDMAMKALELGYTVMLEKPISPTPKECQALLKKAEECHRDVLVCHVLRYTAFFKKIKEILESGVLGELVSLNHQENVGYWHFAHSFVRGNWRNEAISSPLILAKCCHDMDMLTWLLDSRLERVNSFGELKHFKAENAPAGAPLRCTDGCPRQADCPFYAPAMYLTGNKKWPTSVIAEDMSYPAREKALKEGPYGRCVYHCDNDVCDHQVASMRFENGVTATFTVCAFTNACERTMRFMGTKGELRAAMEANEIEVTHFGAGRMTGEKQTYRFPSADSGHGGGDAGIMAHWYDVLIRDAKEPIEFRQSIHSHMMAFALEQSRKSGETISVKAFEDQAGK